MFHCIIFDLDGTLVDSEPLCSKAFLDLLPDLPMSISGLEARSRYSMDFLDRLMSRAATRAASATTPIITLASALISGVTPNLTLLQM